MSMRGIVKIRDIYEIDVINIISLSRFRDGGAAMLAAANRNHHIDMIGVIFINPFIRNMLRVWELS